MASDKKIVLITGGNTGLGIEIVRALCKQEVPYEIIIGCRTVSKGEAAVAQMQQEFPSTTSTLSVVQADLASDESLQQCVSTISSRHNGVLDILVNNGGAGFDNEALAGRMTTREAFNATWDVNVSGTHVLTELAAPLLLKSSDPRLLFMTSGTSPLTETEDLESVMGKRLNTAPAAGWPKKPTGPAMIAYRSSKTGMNMVMREWARMFRNDGVKVFAVSPGFLATNLQGAKPEQLKAMGALDPSVGGNFVKDVILGKRDHHAGKAIREHMVQPW